MKNSFEYCIHSFLFFHVTSLNNISFFFIFQISGFGLFSFLFLVIIFLYFVHFHCVFFDFLCNAVLFTDLLILMAVTISLYILIQIANRCRRLVCIIFSYILYINNYLVNKFAVICSNNRVDYQSYVIKNSQMVADVWYSSIHSSSY